MLERCHHKGHCLHVVATGALFVRHKDNPRGPMDCVCCHCEVHVEVEGYSKNTSPPSANAYRVGLEHGPFKPVGV